MKRTSRRKPRALFAHKIKSGSRTCATCGRPYHRRNRIGTWTHQNPGSRTGWLYEEAKVCVRCMQQKAAQRVLMQTLLRLVPSGAEQRARSGGK